MSDGLLRTLEGKLRAREAELRRTVRALLERLGDPPGAAAHASVADGEAVAADADATRAMALLRQARRELEEVEAALARVASPDFGRCGACAEPIEIPRLRARPESRLCLGCARSLEHARPS